MPTNRLVSKPSAGDAELSRRRDSPTWPYDDQAESQPGPRRDAISLLRQQPRHRLTKQFSGDSRRNISKKRSRPRPRLIVSNPARGSNSTERNTITAKPDHGAGRRGDVKQRSRDQRRRDIDRKSACSLVPHMPSVSAAPERIISWSAHAYSQRLRQHYRHRVV
jgi:hypothetical protein